MKKFVLSTLSALIIFSSSAKAIETVFVQGWYGGLMAGISYTPSIKTNANNPFPPPLIVPGTVDYSVGGGGALQIGYRCNHYRLEGELLGNYNEIRTLSSPGVANFPIKKKSNRLTQDLALTGESILGAGFINGYYDFNSQQGIGDWSPYIGLGIGYAQVATDVTYWVDATGSGYADTRLTIKGLDQTSTHPVGQVIIGISYALDSYTTLAFDGRYIVSANSNSNNNNANNKYEAGMINILFNVSFDAIFNNTSK